MKNCVFVPFDCRDFIGSASPIAWQKSHITNISAHNHNFKVRDVLATYPLPPPPQKAFIRAASTGKKPWDRDEISWKTTVVACHHTATRAGHSAELPLPPPSAAAPASPTSLRASTTLAITELPGRLAHCLHPPPSSSDGGGGHWPFRRYNFHRPRSRRC